MQLPGNRTSLFAWSNRQSLVSWNFVTSSVTFACQAIKHHYLPGSISRFRQFLGNSKKNANMHFDNKVIIFISHTSHLMTKPTKWALRPAKTQISLGIHPVWSESSLSAWRKVGSLATHWAHSEDWSHWADTQANQSLRWAHRPYCWFCHEAAHAVIDTFRFNSTRKHYTKSEWCRYIKWASSRENLSSGSATR